jgi:lipopolysaccharide transport system ATP-binding protein
MRARLGFSTGLITHVDVLFIDEVLAVGDGAFREKAARALKGRVRGEQTVVLVSHNMRELVALSDRAAWIEGGYCREVGEVAQVTAAYSDSLVSAAPTFVD